MSMTKTTLRTDLICWKDVFAAPDASRKVRGFVKSAVKVKEVSLSVVLLQMLVEEIFMVYSAKTQLEDNAKEWVEIVEEAVDMVPLHLATADMVVVTADRYWIVFTTFISSY